MRYQSKKTIADRHLVGQDKGILSWEPNVGKRTKFSIQQVQKLMFETNSSKIAVRRSAGRRFGTGDRERDPSLPTFQHTTIRSTVLVTYGPMPPQSVMTLLGHLHLSHTNWEELQSDSVAHELRSELQTQDRQPFQANRKMTLRTTLWTAFEQPGLDLRQEGCTPKRPIRLEEAQKNLLKQHNTKHKNKNNNGYNNSSSKKNDPIQHNHTRKKNNNHGNHDKLKTTTQPKKNLDMRGPIQAPGTLESSAQSWVIHAPQKMIVWR